MSAVMSTTFKHKSQVLQEASQQLQAARGVASNEEMGELDDGTRSKHKAQTLQRAVNSLQTVAFDTDNADHLAAFELLINGRQHPTLRFIVEAPYTNARQMMYDKIARAFLAQHK